MRAYRKANARHFRRFHKIQDRLQPRQHQLQPYDRPKGNEQCEYGQDEERYSPTVVLVFLEISDGLTEETGTE